MYQLYVSTIKSPVYQYKTWRGLKNRLANMARHSALPRITIKCTLSGHESWVVVTFLRTPTSYGWDAGDAGIPVGPGRTVHGINRNPTLAQYI